MLSFSVSRHIMGMVMVLTLACSPEGPGEEYDPGQGVQSIGPWGTGGASTILPGFATFGHEVRAFRPCGSEETLWAVDSSGVLWDLHQELNRGQEPYGEVFAAVIGETLPPPLDGFGVDYDGMLQVQEIHYVAGEGWACEFDWNRGTFFAQGNEPFWSLVVSPEEMKLSRFGENPVVWAEVAWEPLDGGYLFRGSDTGGQPLEFELAKVPCRGSMSGAYSGFTATVRFRGETLMGCATRGGRQEGPDSY